MKTQRQRFITIKSRMMRILLLLLAFAGTALPFPPSPILAENIPKELLAGVHKNWPPLYSVNEETGKPTGFAIDIMDEVARRAGLNIRYVIFDEWPPIMQAMKEGRIDLIPNFGVAKERSADYDYSSPVEAFHVVIFVRETTYDINGLSDLNGRRVAVVKDNKGLFIVQEFNKAKPVIFNSLDEALLSLLSGNTDALVYPEPPVLSVVNKSKLSGRIKTVGQPLGEVKRAIAVGKGKTELLRKLDAAVQALITAPEYQTIYAKWYHSQEPYWNVQRVLILAGMLLALIVVIFSAGHYLSIRKLNRELQHSLAEHKKTGEKLRLSEERHRLLADNSIDMIWTMNLDGKITYVNPSVEQLYGYRPEEFMELSFAEMFAPESCATVQEGLAMARTNVLARRPLDFLAREVAGRRKDGSIFWSEITATGMYNADGNLTELLGITRDISNRKRIEEALKESEEKYRILVEQANETILIIQDQCFAFVNPKSFDILGVAAEELIGKPFLDYIYPEDQAMLADRHQRRVAGEILPEYYEFRVINKRDNEARWVYIAAKRINWQGRSATLNLLTDISERKQAEALLQDEKRKVEAANRDLSLHRDHLEELVYERTRELAAARDAAETANRAKSAFLANMGHELRTPMHHITGMGHLLSGIVKDERAKDFLAKLQHASRQLLALINDLLDYSKLEADQLRIESIGFSLTTLLDQAELAIREAATLKGLHIVREVEPGLPALLKGDPVRLEQILGNLLSNAVKFSDQGFITLRVHRTEAHLNNVTLCFEVQDQGIGMTPEVQAGLFQLFNQGDNALSRKYGGTGLGLMLSKRLLALMAGEIGCISTPGQGSTFWFRVRLPVGEAPAADRAETGPSDWQSIAKRINYLVRLLADYDANAQNLWHESRQLVEPILQDRLQPFEAALAGFDFDRAKELLCAAVAAKPELSAHPIQVTAG